MPTLSNVVSTFKRRINSTGAAHRSQQPDVDYSTDHSADELNQRNHNILKSLPRPRKKSTKTRSDSIPSSPTTKDYSDQEEPPELRRWSGFKDPFPKISPGGYKRYYESHGGVPEPPKSSSKPLPPKPSKSSSTSTSAGSTVKATITISQPKAKQGPASRSSGRPNGPHGITTPPSQTSPPRSQKTSHPPKSQSQRYRDVKHEQSQYENAYPSPPNSPSDLTPAELDMITSSLLHGGGHGQQVYGYNSGYAPLEYEEDLTSTIRLHDEHDLDIEYPDGGYTDGGYTSDTIFLTYDPPPHNYQKKRLSTIPERPSRSSSLHRLSTMSHVSQTSSIGRSSIVMNPRQRADSTATQGTVGTTHSHTRSNSTGSINSSINTNPSARLRRSQRQVLRTPSLVREFAANEASAPGSGSVYSGGGGSTHASSLHRGPSTSSQTSQLSNASSYAYSNTSSSSPTDTSGGLHSLNHSRSRSGYGSDTPPTTVEDGDENEGLAPLPLPLPPLKKKIDKGKGKARECDNRREKEREGDGREEKEESGDVFDEAGLEAVARRTATSRVNQRTTGKGRRAGYSAAIVAADARKRKSREVKRASKEVKDDEWEDEAEEGNEDWRNTWYTAKTHFSDDGR